jgi:peptidoglycan hydrolase-like protein with peptidoglycan-binding domain
MKFKSIAMSGMIAALMVGRSAPVHADADGLVGGIIGGIIGGAIVAESQKTRKKRSTGAATRSTKSSGVSSAQREANREVQTALNFFGYPVGTPDGAIGPKSRSAISTYQATLGYPATGQLTEYERTLLVTAYYRGMAGGPLVAQTVSTSPMGMKGLLLVQRDEMAGVAPDAAPMVVQPQGTMAAVTPVQPDGAPVVRGAIAAATVAALPKQMPETAPAENLALLPQTDEPAALPNFMGAGAVQVSLASRCNEVALVTNTNGGYTSAAAMTDPNFALSEQFCLARTYAMSQGEELAAQVAGFTPDQIAQQCLAFGDVLAEQVAALSLQPAEEVQAGVLTFVGTSGMSPAQLSGTAKICLGVGYTTDNMDVAIGSALLLTSLGERGYGELLGHHLSQGFGATQRPDLAMGWYDGAVDAIGQGQAVFAPGMADRPAILQKASLAINGRVEELAPAPVIKEASLPDLGVAAPVPEVVVPLSEKSVVTLDEADPALTVLDAPLVSEQTEMADAPLPTGPELHTDTLIAVSGMPDPMTNPAAAALSLAVALPMLIFGN